MTRRGHNVQCSRSYLRLANDVHAENRLRNALLLHLRRMLETTVGDGLKQLRLEQKVAEA
jgi:hypothetical protein